MDNTRFLYAIIFQKNNIVDFGAIRTRIVGVEGEHADHLTTTTEVFSFTTSIEIKIATCGD